MQQFLSHACTVGFDVLCIGGVQHLATKVHAHKFPDRPLALKRILEQSVFLFCIMLFLSHGLQWTSVVAARTMSAHLALHMWLKLRNSTFFERLGMLAFVWVHCLQDYAAWNVLSVRAVGMFVRSCRHLPRVSTTWTRRGEIACVVCVLSWCVWNRYANWSMYLYGAYIPYEWTVHGAKKKQ